MKRGSDAGGGGEIKPEGDPGVVLSLVHKHAARPRLSVALARARVPRRHRGAETKQTPGGGGEPWAPGDVASPGPHLPRLRAASDLREMLEPIQVSVPPL